jgi:hypothetical protein
MNTTIQEFKAILKKNYNDYMKSIKHEDDAMSMSEYHSNDSNYYEREYGVYWDDDKEEWAYTYDNSNYVDEDDEDDEDDENY